MNKFYLYRRKIERSQQIAARIYDTIRVIVKYTSKHKHVKYEKTAGNSIDSGQCAVKRFGKN